ncbi:MAG: PepSY domain-containing protein [Rubrivivax sp.]|nr:MAG: PepSY domain-containing protein [Rubrivivax sp.]
MKEGFRQSMAWLHTWSGLLVGWVLFMIFSAGTATYFRQEITQWMQPEWLHAQPGPLAATHALNALREKAAKANRWSIELPIPREPAVRIGWVEPPASSAKNARGRFKTVFLDPATGAELKARETRGGEFFYRLHFDLHYMPALWARWIVGFCAMFMLVAIVSGVITHKRIFKDLFTFRPKKNQRSWLDAHNATGVLALPFHLMITYSGLITLMTLYMPWGVMTAYQGDQKVFTAEVFPQTQTPKPTGQPGTLTAVEPLLAQAQARWGEAPGRVTVLNPMDAGAVIEVRPVDERRIALNGPVMSFKGGTGELMSVSGDEAPAAATRSVVYGLHVARFAEPWLRALFFVSGLAGCAMVGTGLLLWAVKERQKHAKQLRHGIPVSFGLRLVDGLNIGAIAGLPIAIASYFWANRLLPLGLAERQEAEITCFFAAWGVAAVLGLISAKRRMWRWQLGAGAALFTLLPLLNAFTTDAHLGVTLPAGRWALAGFDLTALALGLGLAACAWVLQRHGGKAARQAPVPKAAKAVAAGA